jgi:hypothetical protein
VDLSRLVPLADAVALLVFVAVGVLTHEASVAAFARDALCFLGSWFAAALLFRLYARNGWWPLLATWLVGVSAGVAVRAAVVGHWPGAFYLVALAFTLLFLLAARQATRLLRNLVAAAS